MQSAKSEKALRGKNRAKQNLLVDRKKYHSHLWSDMNRCIQEYDKQQQLDLVNKAKNLLALCL